jgi:site-specific recombinase XerD
VDIGRIEKDRTVDWQALDAESVADFVLSDTRERNGKGVSTVTTVVRSFLRFLVSRGVLRAGLELAIPRLRVYRHIGIPQHLSKKEMSQLLKYADDGTALGTRDFAILLILMKFGLRGGEVAALELSDIDWRNGEILIRTSKTHEGRKLPLLKSVAEALLDYLRSGRPSTTDRKIFLQHTKPYHAVTASSISKIVGRRLLKAGIRPKMTGSHILRHSVATRLVNNGASFKDIADLLGHRTIESTAIYAKVDLRTLAKIGLPWPGGELK